MRTLRTVAKEQGRSVVIVSHDERIKEFADRVLWLEDGQFKSMVTNPVCGMAIEPKREEAIIARWDGGIAHFCSRGCQEEFMAEPERFVSPVRVEGA